MTKRKVLTILGIVAIASCIVIILFSASEFINPYHSVSEISHNTDSFIMRTDQIQILGDVVNDSILLRDGNITFEITDGEAVLGVIYSGSTPQNFKEGINVVVIGNLISEEIFKANEILTKCPSKYE